MAREAFARRPGGGLDIGDSVELGREYAELKRRLPWLNVMGGCCGTGHRHVEQIATACVPLQLGLRVSRLARGACAPLPGATVDLWHCDAVGVYSDVQDPGGATLGKKFLRGYQTTDADGLARFTTIYPGAYRGRAVHIHFKIRSAAAGGRVHDFTSQLFFDDALSDQVYAQPPYAGRGEQRLRNARDGIFRNAGAQLTLVVTPAAPGYAGAFELALETG